MAWQTREFTSLTFACTQTACVHSLCNILTRDASTERSKAVLANRREVAAVLCGIPDENFLPTICTAQKYLRNDILTRKFRAPDPWSQKSLQALPLKLLKIVFHHPPFVVSLKAPVRNSMWKCRAKTRGKHFSFDDITEFCCLWWEIQSKSCKNEMETQPVRKSMSFRGAMQWGFVFSRELGTRQPEWKIKQVSEAVKRSMYRVIAMITEFSIFRRCKKAGDCKKAE